MASVVVPNLQKHGLAALFVAGSAQYLPAPALAVFVSDKERVREEAVREVSKKLQYNILKSYDIENKRQQGRLLVFEPRAGVDTKAFWKVIGLDTSSLDKVNASQSAFAAHTAKTIRALGISKSFFDPVYVGISRYSCHVHDGPLGRVAISMKDDRVFREWEPSPKGGRMGDVHDFFLRAETHPELWLSARGAVRMMLNGSRFNVSSFAKLYEHVVAPPLRETLTLNDWHEQVEAACVLMVRNAAEHGRAPKQFAQLLNARLPNRFARAMETSRYDQFSTPLPVAAGAAMILAPRAGETLLEPMVGNGVLASSAAAMGANVTGIEIDGTRADRARQALGADATIVESSFEDFMAKRGDQLFDMVLINPPFATNYKAKTIKDFHGRDIRLARPDQAYAYEALKALKPDGRAFIVLAGDYVQEGKLDGSRRVFDNVLRSNFEVCGSAVLDGGLYRKMGTTFPVQMYAVGPRRDVPLSLEETEAQAPIEIPVARTWDEFFAWTEQVRDNMAAVMAKAQPGAGWEVAARAGYRPGPDGASAISAASPWDDPVAASGASDVMLALAQDKAVRLPAGDGLLRVEISAAGWILALRDPAGNITHQRDSGAAGYGWTKEQALAAGIGAWETAAKRERALEQAGQQLAQRIRETTAPGVDAESSRVDDTAAVRSADAAPAAAQPQEAADAAPAESDDARPAPAAKPAGNKPPTLRQAIDTFLSKVERDPGNAATIWNDEFLRLVGQLARPTVKLYIMHYRAAIKDRFGDHADLLSIVNARGLQERIDRALDVLRSRAEQAAPGATDAPRRAARGAGQAAGPTSAGNADTAEPEATAARPTVGVPASDQQASPVEEPDPLDDLSVPAFAPIEIVDEDDPFLLPYEPMSRLGEPTTRIQRSLSSPIMAALADVQRRYGDVDEMVAERMGLPISALEKRFSPEQIDGLALSFAARERRAGFLNADLMGVGKGRFLAGHLARALKEDRPLIFFTERPELFQDFVARDLCDVLDLKPGDLPQLLRPFILNNHRNARILDYENRDKNGSPTVLFKHEPSDLTAAREKKMVPLDCNIVLATYSQFSHAAGGWKAEAISNWMAEQALQGKVPDMLIDEAHRAAGDMSRCGDAVTALVTRLGQLGAEPVYSSGTPLKGMKNIGVYAPILPDVGMSREQLLSLVEGNPHAIQEALSYEMARAGNMISREMDQAGVVRNFVNLVDLNPEKYEHLKGLMDVVSGFLAEMMEKSGEVKSAAKMIEKNLKKLEERDKGPQSDDNNYTSQVQVTSASPATRFHTISQYMMFAFKANFAEELALGAIANGQKPLLVVENVGDSMVEYMLGLDVDDDDDAPAPVAGHDATGNRTVSRLPDLSDLLVRTADAMLTITQQNGWGVVDKVRLVELEPWLEDFSERVSSSGLGDLSTSGIDLIRERLARYDISVGELTKRRFELHRQEDGGYLVENRSKPAVQDIVRDFNEGSVDCVVINRSASSGISMQASPRNGGDLRQRNMIKLQLQADITHERQLDGRIHRTGQVQTGRYTIPMSGFAADDRLCAMFNRKNRSLSSASHATRENATNIDQAPDLLNSIGDTVCYNFLKNAPMIAERFGIELSEEVPEDLARKVMGRMIVLPSDMQTAIGAELESAFRLRLADLEAQGQNPLKLSRYEWGATVSPVRTLVAGDENAESAARRPVVMNEISYTEPVRPMKWERVEELVSASRERWSHEIGRFVGLAEAFPELEALAKGGDVDFGASIFDRVMNRDEGLASLGLETIPVSIAEEILDRRKDEPPQPPEEDEAGKKSRRQQMSSLERNIVESVDRARYLASIVEKVDPGVMVGIDPKVFPSVSDTYFYEQWGEAHDDDAPVIPAIVKDVRYPKDRPLNLGEWELDLAIPGEPNVTTFSLASLYGAQKFKAEVDRAEGGDGRVVPSLLNAQETLARLVVDGTPSENEAILAAVSAARDAAPEDAGAAFTAVAKKLFDSAEPGEVTRKRYTLEGNIFAAVSLSVGKKLGEKIIYTAQDGELRHAILLKNERVDKLNLKLDTAVSERVCPAPKDGQLVASIMSLARAVIDYSKVTASIPVIEQRLKDTTERFGATSATHHKFELERLRSRVAPLSANLALHATEIAAPYLSAKKLESVRTYLTSPAGETAIKPIATKLIDEVRKSIKMSAALVIGDDPIYADAKGVKKSPCPVEEQWDGSFKVATDLQQAETKAMCKTIGRDRPSAIVLLTGNVNYLICHGKGPYPDAVPDLAWGSTKTKLAGGCIIGAVRTGDEFTELMHTAAANNRSVTLHGPLRAIYEMSPLIAREMTRAMDEHLEVSAALTSAAVSPSMEG